jgi:hypothetical protein
MHRTIKTKLPSEVANEFVPQATKASFLQAVRDHGDIINLKPQKLAALADLVAVLPGIFGRITPEMIARVSRSSRQN